MGGMAVRSRALIETAAPVLRPALGFVIACSILGFVFMTFVYLTIWFGEGDVPWAYEKERPALELYYQALKSRYPDATSLYPPLYGSTAVLFLFMFGGVLLAAVCTLALRSLPTKRVSADAHPGKIRRIGRRVWVQVRRIIFYQLPPRQTWIWWCGGLTILDVFLYLAVCAMCALGCQQLVKGMYKYIADSIAAGTFEDYYEGSTVNEAKLEGIALRSGFMIYPAFVYSMFPVARNSFLQALFNTDFSGLIKWHRWLGHLVIITTSIHGILYYVLWGIQSNFRVEFRHWQQHGIANLNGSISYFFGLIMWVTSIDYVRRHFFEVFYRLHIVCAIGFYVFGYMHYDGFYYYAAPSMVLYFLDLTFRLAQWMNVSIVTGSLLSENVLALHLKFNPETKLEPNSFIFMSCPDCSRTEWHPFTLSLVSNSTSPDQPATATIYLKPYGQWVSAVVKRITQKGSVLAKIDGPYGGSSSLIRDDCKAAVIFAGGVGVTPMLGLLAALRERRHSAEFHGSVTCPAVPQKIVFVWACRNPDEFTMMDQLLLAEAREKDSWLDVRLHCTGKWISQPAKRVSPGSSDGKAPPGSDSDNNADYQAASLSLETAERANRASYPPVERPELKLASPFFLKPSLLQGYGIGYPMWAFVHILSFFGAFFAPLTTNHYSTLEYATNEGPDGYGIVIYWVVCTVHLIAFLIGSMGMPAAIIFPIFLWRRRRARLAMRNELSSHASTVPNPKDSPTSVEEGAMQTYHSGRPNVKAILEQMKLEYAHLPVINVYAAGPASMVRDVKSAAISLNKFMGTAAELKYEIDSFAL